MKKINQIKSEVQGIKDLNQDQREILSLVEFEKERKLNLLKGVLLFIGIDLAIFIPILIYFIEAKGMNF